MPAVGTTAVVAWAPAANELLDIAAGVDPGVVRPGIPAHASIAYPFLPAAEFTPATADTLRGLVGDGGPVAVRLASLISEPGFVGVLVPELDPVAAAVRRQWPQLTPYGGRFGDAPPVHVTVAMGAEPAAAELIAARAADRLPLVAEVRELHVVGLTEAGWRPLATVALC
ncbi:MAG TPA: 2'-5' RNA ligase family protein [Pseudonocardiaceae bacterium]|jgi:hypothetical protein|nr:2'-5' RNA ligase family protein [Pseudonocardiaceae bacterium]